LQKNLLTFFSKKFLNFLTIANCIMDWLIFWSQWTKYWRNKKTVKFCLFIKFECL
jgi:hypothetical protein